MIVIIGIALIFIMLFFGVPIYLSMGIGAMIVCIFQGGINFTSIANSLFNNIDSFTLLAIPLFVLAGYLISDSGMAKRLVSLINLGFGRAYGGLAMGMVVVCAIFGSMSGSSFACAAAIGTTMMPSFEKEGYKLSFGAGLLSVASILGNLIPPSVTLIIISTLVSAGIDVLFAGTVIPGLILTALMAIVAYFVSRKRGYRSAQIIQMPWKVRLRECVSALPALFTPVIILGGIYSGIFTPTESAAIAVLYAVLVGCLVYRDLTWSTFWRSLTKSIRLSGMIFILVTAALLMNQAFVLSKFPQFITSWMLGFELNSITYFLLLIPIVLILGCIADASIIIYICIPLVYPVATELGINPVHLATFFLVTIMVGTITPPIGISLFFCSGLTKVPFKDVVRESIPFTVTALILVFLVAFIPELSLWLPGIIKNT
jgi:C4-dicarboxylate transporter, DctM subunit